MGLRANWKKFKLPDKIEGKTFCEIGCWDGSLCAEAMTRGAKRAVGIDMCVCDELKRKKKKFGFEFQQIDIFSEKFLALPTFDIVSNCGVLYHLENPFSAMVRTARLVKPGGIILIETLTTLELPKVPIMKFFENHESRWWAPNDLCLRQMMKSVGCTDIKEVWRHKRGPKVGRVAYQGRVTGSMQLNQLAPRRELFMEVNNPNPT
jgi:SAM-dependent methyltransferase